MAANIRGTNFKTISVIRNIKSEGMLDVVIYVGTVKVATFTCPESCISQLILANL